ncbi:MAG: acyltransferase family protein [Cyanobacteriota bacterium]|jgi:peptidoglycan/LPS O-acetylase OafA/YrhL
MTSSQTSHYRPEIDGLRAVAVLAVLFNHLHGGLFPSGFLGVDVFFVISGYVITSSLIHREHTSFSGFILSFYGRRFKRLIPALLACIVISSLIYCLFVQMPRASLWTGVAAAFGVANIQLYSSQTDYFATSTDLNLFLHTWSLGVEEQFYLLYPLIFWLAYKRQRLLKRLLVLGAVLGAVVLAIAFQRSGMSLIPGFMRAQGKLPYGVALLALAALFGGAYRLESPRRHFRALFLVLGVLSAVSLLFFWLLTKANSSAAFYLMPHRFWEMGAGCLLALWAIPGSRSRGIGVMSRRLRGGSTLFLLLICVSFFLPEPWKAVTTPLVVALTLLLTVAMDADPQTLGLAKRLLSLPVMLTIGLLSYSLYLWHWPLLVIARWTIGVEGWTLPLLYALIAVATWLSYRYVEAPLRRARWAATNRTTIGYGIGSECAAAGMLVALLSQPTNVLYSGTNKIPFSLGSLSVPGSDITVMNCGRFDEQILKRCLLEPKQGQFSMFLFGDSHAGHLYPAMGEVRARTGMGLVTFNMAGNAHQPFPVISFGSRPGSQSGNSYLDRLPAKGKEATTFYNLVSAKMERGDVVVLAADLYRYFDVKQPEADVKFMSWKAAIAKLAKDLEGRGVQVILFAPFPRFEAGGGPNCEPQWFRPKIPPSCLVSLPMEEVERERRGFVTALKRLAAAHQNVSVYDPLPLFCRPSWGECRNHDGQKVFYLDGDHLSPNSAAMIADDFVSFLRARGLVSP